MATIEGVRAVASRLPRSYEALVASEPDKFLMPTPADMRYHWVEVRLDAIDDVEMREIVIDAWRMVVPKRVAADYLGDTR